MLLLNDILNNKEGIVKALRKKHFESTEILDQIIEIDKKRRNAKVELDDVLSESNKLSKEIGLLFKQGKREEAEEIKKRTTLLKDKSKELNDIFTES